MTEDTAVEFVSHYLISEGIRCDWIDTDIIGKWFTIFIGPDRDNCITLEFSVSQLLEFEDEEFLAMVNIAWQEASLYDEWKNIKNKFGG